MNLGVEAILHNCPRLASTASGLSIKGEAYPLQEQDLGRSSHTKFCHVSWVVWVKKGLDIEWGDYRELW